MVSIEISNKEFEILINKFGKEKDKKDNKKDKKDNKKDNKKNKKIQKLEEECKSLRVELNKVKRIAMTPKLSKMWLTKCY